MSDTDEESFDTFDKSEYAYNDEVIIPEEPSQTSVPNYLRRPDDFLTELIPLVKKYPILYDCSIIRNCNKMKTRSKAWAQIARKISFSVDGDYCKLRWTRIRMVMTRILRVHREQVKKGIFPPNSEPPWKYFKPLRFLVPHIRMYGQRNFQSYDEDYVLPRHVRDEVPANCKREVEQECETIEIDDDDEDDVANCGPTNTDPEPAPSLSSQIEENSLNSVTILDAKYKKEEAMVKDEKHNDKTIINDTKSNALTHRAQVRYMGASQSDELLIQTIKKYPVFYVFDGKTQEIRQTRLAKWKEVAKEMGLKEPDIRERWETLKRQFLYILKKDPRKLNRCERAKNKWLVDQMQFVAPHLRNTYRNQMLRRHMSMYEWLNTDTDEPIQEEIESSSNAEDINEEEIKEEDNKDDDSITFSDDEAEDFVLTSFLTNVLKKTESRVNNRNAIDVAEDELSCYTNFFSG